MVSTKKNDSGEGNIGTGDKVPQERKGGTAMLKKLEMLLESLYSECAHVF